MLMSGSQAGTEDAGVSPRRQSWLLFVHQVPADESNLRVRVWRRLQQIGALAIKQAVYALPDSAGAREDLEWLRREVADGGGQAALFVSHGIDADTDHALVREFREAREEAYKAIASEAEALLRAYEHWQSRRRGKAPEIARPLDTLRQRFIANQQLDVFGSAGREEVAVLLQRLDACGQVPVVASAPARRAPEPGAYRGRLWVTRPQPGVDRMSSAWLIRHFIDPAAQFGFAADVAHVPAGAVSFDMYGGEFTHRGEHCTFEELSDVFGIRDPAVTRIAAIVHDLDLKDGQFGAPDAALIGTLVDGLGRAHDGDAVLLEHGITLFDALYRGAVASATSAGGQRQQSATRDRQKRRPPAARRTAKRR
jgi:hypothetical protein